MIRKIDWPPLLAPGRHFLTLSDIKRLGVDRFTADDRNIRYRMFLSLEQVVQDLLIAKIPCEVRIDGSFLTEKPDPGDIDIVISLDFDVAEQLTQNQIELTMRLNEQDSYVHIDSSVWTLYPRGHKCFRCAFDADVVSEGYGIENSEVYLKGIAVLRVWETDVGLRIHR